MTSQQLFELAMQHHRAGRLAEAEPLYRQLLAMHPREPDVLHLLGVLAGDAGDQQAAVNLIRQAIAINPSAANYHSNIANSLLALHRLDEAVAAAENAVRLHPGLAVAHYNLGLARLLQRQWDAAVPAFEAALRLQPDYALAHLNLGNVRQGQGRLDEAIASFRNGLARAPRHAALWNNLGDALRMKGDLAGAAEACRTAAECDPRDPRILNNLALVLMNEGHAHESIDVLQRSLALDPAQPEVRSNLIFIAHRVSDSGALIHEQLTQWQQLHAAPLRKTWPAHANDRSPDRPLRIGYVSPDFRDHAVGRTLLPVFLAHNRTRFDFTCYSETEGSDAVAEKFRANMHWRTTTGLSDEQVAAQIRADRIDVLVDLALHTAHHRLLVFARKPAPVQATFAGYPGSTGLEAIDYRITDPHLEAPGTSAGVEEPVRLPDSFWCFAALENEPAPNPLPVLTCGHVTFGCLNSFAKLNRATFARWSRVLHSVPASHLLLLSPHGPGRESTLAQFNTLGITSDRVHFTSSLPRADYLALHHRIDVMLDTYPYNGHVTTGDALWMGVPVVSLAGQTPVSRGGLSLLSNVGLADLVATNEDDFVRIAVELATRLDRLAALRGNLRLRMQASPLLDAPRFARHLENAYRTMWQRWCST